MLVKLIATFAAICLLTSGAQAQSAALRSASLKKGVDCLAQTAAEGRRTGLTVDYEKDHPGELFALHPSQEMVHPLLVSAMKCMDEAFPRRTSLTLAQSSQDKVGVWYDQIDEHYAWCSTRATNSNLANVRPIGGQGQQRNWFGFYFRCGAGQRIFGLHTP